MKNSNKCPKCGSALYYKNTNVLACKFCKHTEALVDARTYAAASSDVSVNLPINVPISTKLAIKSYTPEEFAKKEQENK